MSSDSRECLGVEAAAPSDAETAKPSPGNGVAMAAAWQIRVGELLLEHFPTLQTTPTGLEQYTRAVVAVLGNQLNDCIESGARFSSARAELQRLHEEHGRLRTEADAIRKKVKHSRELLRRGYEEMRELDKAMRQLSAVADGLRTQASEGKRNGLIESDAQCPTQTPSASRLAQEENALVAGTSTEQYMSPAAERYRLDTAEAKTAEEDGAEVAKTRRRRLLGDPARPTRATCELDEKQRRVDIQFKQLQKLKTAEDKLIEHHHGRKGRELDELFLKYRARVKSAAGACGPARQLCPAHASRSHHPPALKRSQSLFGYFHSSSKIYPSPGGMGPLRSKSSFELPWSIPERLTEAAGQTGEPGEGQREQATNEPLPAVVNALRNAPADRSSDDIDILLHFMDNHKFFADLSAMMRRELCQSARLCSVDGGHILFEQGDIGDSFYVILSGSVSVIVEDQFGHSKVVKTLTRNQSFGEIALLQGKRRSASCVAREPSHLLQIGNALYDRVIKSSKVSTVAGDVSRHILVKMSAAERLSLAAHYIEDAANEREIHVYHNGKWAKLLQRALDSPAYQAVVIIVILAHLLLVVFEPPSRLDAQHPRYADTVPVLLAVEWLFLGVYVVDASTRTYLSGAAVRRRPLNSARWIVCLLILVDLICASATRGTLLRFSRPLRPGLLLLQSTHLRKMYLIAWKCVPRLFELAVIILSVLVVFMILGFHLFAVTGDLYRKDAWAAGDPAVYPSCEGQPCAPVESFIFNSFASPSQAALSLFVLLTAENWPDVTYPPFMNSVYFNAYFLSFMTVGLFFLMNLIVAVLYDAYREVNAEVSMMERLRERQALHNAFIALDHLDAGAISHDLFSALMKRLRPDYEEYMVSAIFALMDTDSNGLLEEIEFFEICDMLFLKISQQAKQDPSWSWLQWLHSLGIRDICKSFIESTAFHRFVFSVITIDLICLLAMTEAEEALSVLDAICVSVLAVEACLNFFVYGRERIAMHLVHLTGTAACIVGVVAYYAGDRRLSALRFLGLFRVFRVINLLDRKLTSAYAHEDDAPRSRAGDAASEDVAEAQALQQPHALPTHNRGATEADSAKHADRTPTGSGHNASWSLVHGFSTAFVNIMPVFLAIAFALVSVVMYSYALVGMEVFAAAAPGGSRCSPRGTINNDVYARFCGFPEAMLALFQVLTTSNWHQVMYAAMDQTSAYAAWYFVSYFLVAVLLILNLGTAVLLDAFLLETRLKRRGQGVQLHQLLARSNTLETVADEYPRSQSDMELHATTTTDTVHVSDWQYASRDSSRVRLTSSPTSGPGDGPLLSDMTSAHMLSSMDMLHRVSVQRTQTSRSVEVDAGLESSTSTVDSAALTPDSKHSGARHMYEASRIMIGVVNSFQRWKRVLAKAYQQTDNEQAGSGSNRSSGRSSHGHSASHRSSARSDHHVSTSPPRGSLKNHESGDGDQRNRQYLSARRASTFQHDQDVPLSFRRVGDGTPEARLKEFGF